MTWDPSLPGLGEATRLWIMDIIRADLTRLNTALARDGLLSVPITSSMIMRGDPENLPSVDQAPVMICVSSGGDFGSDMRIEQKYVPVSYKNEIYSAILVYLHPETLPKATGIALGNGRETLVDRVCDWLRGGVFNTQGHVYAVLQSKEYSETAFDMLNQCHVQQVEQGWTNKGFAGSRALYHGRLVHAAWTAATAAS